MTKVGYLGPQWSYTNQAAEEHFKYSDHVVYLPCPTITDGFRTLATTSRLDYAVLPLSNTSLGPVVESQVYLSSDQVEAIEEIAQVKLTIRHCVFRSSQAGKDDPVEEIISHPQALGQCQHYLSRRYPHAQQTESDSTSSAAQYVQSHPKSIAICSKEAGIRLGLLLVDDLQGVGVQDVGEGNVTTFGVFRKKEQ